MTTVTVMAIDTTMIDMTIIDTTMIDTTMIDTTMIDTMIDTGVRFSSLFNSIILISICFSDKKMYFDVQWKSTRF